MRGGSIRPQTTSPAVNSSSSHSGSYSSNLRRSKSFSQVPAGTFESFEHANDTPQRRSGPVSSDPRNPVMRQQESEECVRVDRLHLRPQAFKREAVNSREKPSLAPFDVARFVRELAAEDDALRSSCVQRDLNRRQFQTELAGNPRSASLDR